MLWGIIQNYFCAWLPAQCIRWCFFTGHNCFAALRQQILCEYILVVDKSLIRQASCRKKWEILKLKTITEKAGFLFFLHVARLSLLHPWSCHSRSGTWRGIWKNTQAFWGSLLSWESEVGVQGSEVKPSNRRRIRKDATVLKMRAGQFPRKRDGERFSRQSEIVKIVRKKNGFQNCFLHWLHRCWSDQHVQDVVTLKMGLMVMTAFGEENGAGKGNVGYQQLSQGSN